MKTSIKTLFKPSALVAAALLLAGCSVAPAYEKPLALTPASYKEAADDDNGAALKLDQSGTWKPAEPSEAVARGEWWTVFGDDTLDGLETQALQANQDLKVAAARVKEARAFNQATRASLFPTLDAGFGPTREGLSAASQFRPDGTSGPTQTLWRAEAGASYEVNLFGKVSSSVDASRAELQQSEALFRSVQLALQGDVAQNYFALRELDAEAAVLMTTVDLRSQALKLIRNRHAEGEISDLDVARAETELATAQSEAMTVQRLRAASEHSLAVLLGKAPAEFSIVANPLQTIDVRIPVGLPSTLLERRPDIAAAERGMAAANARVGVAKAAFFPSLTLTGAGGFESGSLENLFNWSSRTFLLGPLAGTAVNVPIFDGGRRQGELDNSRAMYEEEVARYRQQVLTAFREVEDNLADLRILESQTQTQAQAVDASARAARLSRAQYTEGATSYLEVIDAERTALQSRRAAAQLQGAQAEATVKLIRALGGGWGDIPAPTSDKIAKR